MRGWLLALLVAMALAPSASAAQQICKFNNYGQTFEYPCGSGDAPPTAAEDPP